jgi:hypothetical protein
VSETLRTSFHLIVTVRDKAESWLDQWMGGIGVNRQSKGASGRVGLPHSGWGGGVQTGKKVEKFDMWDEDGKEQIQEIK